MFHNLLLGLTVVTPEVLDKMSVLCRKNKINNFTCFAHAIITFLFKWINGGVMRTWHHLAVSDVGDHFGFHFLSSSGLFFGAIIYNSF